MTLTHYGIREWGSAFIVMLLLLAGSWYLYFKAGYPRTAIAVAAVSVILFLAIAAFFRNPCRRIPGNPLLIISPADGTIKDIVSPRRKNQRNGRSNVFAFFFTNTEKESLSENT